MPVKFWPLIFLLSMCLGACSVPHSTDSPNFLTYQRGQQLLAAGSPKSAIPLLTQSIAAAPDGPEPVALLALAYALDLQSQRAIIQAQHVNRPAGTPGGWETIAVGIANMTQHQNTHAIEVLRQTAATAPAGSALRQGALQWLAVAYLLDGDRERATVILQRVAEVPQMHTTALLWILLIQAQQGNTAAATENLAACAKLVLTDSGREALTGDLATVDNQTLYDTAIAMLASSDLKKSRQYFTALQERNMAGSDAGVWLALISGVEHDWQACRNGLKAQTLVGTEDSRGLANQLYSMVCALEDRPEDVVIATLAGQRLLGRSSIPEYIIESPKPEGVWASDSMK